MTFLVLISLVLCCPFTCTFLTLLQSTLVSVIEISFNCGACLNHVYSHFIQYRNFKFQPCNVMKLLKMDSSTKLNSVGEIESRCTPLLIWNSYDILPWDTINIFI